MPSTTAELTIVEARDKEPSRFVQGCRVLLSLLAASPPSTLEQERLALEVLQVLSGNLQTASRPEGDLAAERDLKRALEQLSDDRTGAVLTATDLPKGLGAWFRPGERRRRERSRLLFTIVVYVGGTLLRYPGPAKLIKAGVVGGPRETNRLLRWIGRGVPAHGDRQLRRLFLDVARDALLNDPDVSDAQDARTFMRDPWIRQLLVLERHWLQWKRDTPRGVAAAERNPGLALEPGSLEYDLARAQGFSKLRRQAGPVGRASLDQMGYVDYRPRGLRWPVAIAIVTLAMAVLGTVAFAIAQARVRAWDKANGETASVLRERAKAEDAPSPANAP
jgi:hypothetical protein